MVAIDGAADHLSNLNMSLALNGWLDRARLYHAVASADREVYFNGWNAEAAAAAEQGQGYARDHDRSQAKSFSSQAPLALDDVVGDGEEVAYLKVDVESHEPSVFRSARRLVEARAVKYVLFEWTYYMGGKYHFANYVEHVLTPLFASGYRCFLAAHAPANRLEVTSDTLAAAVQRLHAHCSGLAVPAGQRWCMDNVVCARAATSRRRWTRRSSARRRRPSWPRARPRPLAPQAGDAAGGHHSNRGGRQAVAGCRWTQVPAGVARLRC